MAQRLFFLAIAVVAVVLTGVSLDVRAQAPTSITSCSGGVYEIKNPGSFLLANNLTAAQGQPCLRIRGSGAHDVTIDGNNKTITVNGGAAVEVADYDDGPPARVLVKNFTSNGGVTTYGNNVNHVTFEGLTVSGINIGGSDDDIVRNNVVGSGGIQVNPNDTEGWYPLRTLVEGNTVTGSTTTGTKIMLEVWGGKVHPCPRLDTVVRNNTVTNHRNDPPPEATASIRVRCATHVQFTNNTIHSTGTTIGFYMRDEADDGVYADNSFWTNSQETIRIASGNPDKTFPSRNTFRNNIFRSDQGQINFLQGIGSNNVFSNNIFWGRSTGLINQNAGNIYDHNTFYLTGSGPLQELDYDDGPTADVWTNNVLSYSGSQVFNITGWAFSRYDGHHNLFNNRSGSVSFGSYASSLSSWQAQGADANSIEANPLFTNAAGGDFSLQSGSPAIGAGTGGTNIGVDPTAVAPPPPPPPCAENWQCTSWGTCTNGQQSRTCTDLNNCGTTVSKPNETQSCTVGCNEDWQCTSWSVCSGSQQSRTCTDQNSCGTTVNKPPESQSCTDPGTSPNPPSDPAPGGGAAGVDTPGGRLGVGFLNPINCASVTCIVVNIARYVLGSLAVLATLMFIWGGFMMLTSGGIPERIQKAKTTLTWAAIGIVVMLLSWSIVQFGLRSLLER